MEQSQRKPTDWSISRLKTSKSCLLPGFLYWKRAIFHLYMRRIIGGVLRYISDGDVRSPLLGLKFAIWGLFLGLKFCSDFFWVRDFGKNFFGGWQKAKPRVLVFMSNNCIMTQKLSGILLNYYYYYYYYYYFIWTFLGYVLGHWTFFGSGSSLKDFFWV